MIKDANNNVTECEETNWKVCCGCPDFRVESEDESLQRECIFKDGNRIGIIPNLIDPLKGETNAVT